MNSEEQIEYSKHEIVSFSRVPRIELGIGEYLTLAVDDLTPTVSAKANEILKSYRENNEIHSWEHDAAASYFLASGTVGAGTTIPEVANKFGLESTEVRNSAKRLHRDTDVKTDYISRDVEMKSTKNTKGESQ